LNRICTNKYRQKKSGENFEATEKPHGF